MSESLQSFPIAQAIETINNIPEKIYELWHYQRSHSTLVMRIGGSKDGLSLVFSAVTRIAGRLPNGEYSSIQPFLRSDMQETWDSFSAKETVANRENFNEFQQRHLGMRFLMENDPILEIESSSIYVYPWQAFIAENNLP